MSDFSKAALEAEGAEVRTLYGGNPWVEVREVVKPSAGINGYAYSHEPWCDGQKVAILPYRDTPDGRHYLLRREVTPSWGLETQYSAITGGYEGGSDLRDDATRELEEEAGYKVFGTDLIWLGESYGTKSTDTVYSLYSANLTGREALTPRGDGSRVEAAGCAVWAYPSTIALVGDPQVSTMYVRLIQRLEGGLS